MLDDIRVIREVYKQALANRSLAGSSNRRDPAGREDKRLWEVACLRSFFRCSSQATLQCVGVRHVTGKAGSCRPTVPDGFISGKLRRSWRPTTCGTHPGRVAAGGRLGTGVLDAAALAISDLSSPADPRGASPGNRSRLSPTGGRQSSPGSHKAVAVRSSAGGDLPGRLAASRIN
jgi:hypothetical protein